MLIRSLREAADPRQVNGFFTKVSMPVRIAPEFAEDAFLRPLARALHEAELGEIVEHEIELDDAGGNGGACHHAVAHHRRIAGPRADR